MQFNPREITIFFPRKMPESNILCRKDSSLVVIFGNKTDQFEAAELHLFFLKHFCTTEAIPITELYRHELSCIIYLQRQKRNQIYKIYWEILRGALICLYETPFLLRTHSNFSVLQIRSADKLSFGLNVLFPYSSYCFSYFLLYKNCSC